ncbi:MAG: SCO family protein [Propionibacteriaceae bacterium]
MGQLSRTRTVFRGVRGAVLLGLVCCLALACTAPGRDGSAGNVTRHGDSGGFRGAYLDDPYTMPEMTLTDTGGNDFNLRTTPSKPVTLVFFGYTNCPDVCLSVLADVATALNRMEPAQSDQIQLVFITTDPARDDEATIRSYLDRFDPSFVGLTGSIEGIKQVAGQVGVDIEGMKKLPSGGYEVGHSAQVVGFGSEQQASIVWTPSTPIGDLMHDFALLVDKQR